MNVAKYAVIYLWRFTCMYVYIYHFVYGGNTHGFLSIVWFTGEAPAASQEIKFSIALSSYSPAVWQTFPASTLKLVCFTFGLAAAWPFIRVVSTIILVITSPGGRNASVITAWEFRVTAPVAYKDYIKIGHEAYFLSDTARLRWVCCTVYSNRWIFAGVISIAQGEVQSGLKKGCGTVVLSDNHVINVVAIFPGIKSFEAVFINLRA